MIPRAACFDVPKWHSALWGEHAAATSEVARVSQVGDAKAAGFSDGYLPELFHRLYSDAPREVPPEERGPAAALRAKLHKLAGELPEFSTLRKQTVHDPVWSGMAAAVLGENVAQTLPVPKPNKDGKAPPDADAANRILDGLRDLESEGAATAEQVAAAAGRAFAEGEAVEGAAGDIDDGAVRQALRRAVEAAQDAIDETKATASAFGYGPGGAAGGELSPDVALALARKVKASPKLRRIVELAGRLQATARAKKATRSEYARSELVGVEQTGDVARLLPSELAHLGGNPVLATDLLRRVVERTALGYKLRGTEKTAKGPIVVGIDCSGSMSGDKEIWAAAIALAALDSARRDKRAFCVLRFDGRVRDLVYVAKNEPINTDHLIQLVTKSAAGGCDFDLPIEPCLNVLEEHKDTLGKADVILITDACIDRARYESRRQPTLDRAAKLGAHIFGILIGSSGEEALKAWTHEAVRIDDVNRDTEAVDLVFDKI